MTRSQGSGAEFSFLVLDQHVRVTCLDALLTDVVLGHYAAMAATMGGRPPDLPYIVGSDPASGGYSLVCPGQAEVTVPDLGTLLFCLDQDLTIALQRRRPDLLFLHAAALEHAGRAYLLAGDSGNGKSTTAWGLLHHGFGYLSDELGPIDLASLDVLPFQRALCLKRAPPAAYPLPGAGVFDFGDSMHVPVPALPARAVADRCRLGAVLFVRYRADLPAPVLRATSPAEAGARMYVNTLNALAHPGRGLDAVVRIVERVPCFVLESADLRSTCGVVRGLADAPAC